MIREANSEDTLEIAKVHVDSWRFAYKGIIEDQVLDSLDYSKRSENWKLVLQESSLPMYVSESNEGEITGFVHVSEYRGNDLGSENIGEITSIYIRPELVGTGLGYRLFQKAKASLTEAGFTKIVLWVLEENKLGSNFYKHCGMKPDNGKTIHPKTGLVELRYAMEV
ncbi:GNAT family N-acetyltransferase [Reinekea marina]|uniref:GNAT family N-acetyltransferase n=1 Tax=Reinekea marina TaxID=1310421 RepID=A0ABV7WUE5_9GAMM|nr:GNAT family N-acetyltransferase [Reinekea marina]MDN3650054.1 GNAT family N-acetyltransferase [Reinekea marina]